MKGFVSQDNVFIGSILIVKQDFAEISQFQMFGGSFDGVMGLGFSAKSINGLVTPLENMVAQGALDQPVVAFRLGFTGSIEGEGGTVSFGGIDDTAYNGRIRYFSTRISGLWEVPLYQVTLGWMTIDLDKDGAAFDTGSSIIAMPSDLAYRFNKGYVWRYIRRSVAYSADTDVVSEARKLGTVNIRSTAIQSKIYQTYLSRSEARPTHSRGRTTS